jgi:hypothetical protein
MEGGIMIINSDFEFGFMIITFALLGAILIGSLPTSKGLERWHPRLLGATVGALLGFVLIEAVPMLV